MAKAKLTFADFLGIPEDEPGRHELIGGELVVTPGATQRHEYVVANCVFALVQYERATGRGRTLASNVDVDFDTGDDPDVLQPDVKYFAPDRLDFSFDERVRRAPTIAVEVLSPSTRRRDLTIKRELYHRYGVGEYWVIDPDALVVEADPCDGTGSRWYGVGDVLTSPLLDRFELPLTELFAGLGPSER